MVKSGDGYGEWDKGVLVKGGKGMIEGCGLWDEEGGV